jgi:hypothetical protein
MRNYIDFYLTTGDVFNEPGHNFTFSITLVDNELDLLMQDMDKTRNQLAASNQSVTFYGPGQLFCKLDLDNVVSLLSLSAPSLMTPTDPDPVLGNFAKGAKPAVKFIVDESPRKSWSHGH